MAFAPTPKNPGDLIRSQDWNEAIDEVVRLESAKLDLAGGTVSGSLRVTGSLGVGSAAPPNRALTIRGSGGAYLNVMSDTGSHEVLLGADAAGGIVSTMTNHDLHLRAGGNVTRLTVKADGKVGIGTTAPGFLLDVNNRIRLRQNAAETAGLWLFQTMPNADRAFIGMMDDNTVGFWGNAGIGWGLKMNVGNGDITLEGDLYVRKTDSGYARFTNSTFSNEGTFLANNLKLVMGGTGLVIGGAFSYEFSIGHTFTSLILGGGITTSFTKRFSVTQDSVIITAPLVVNGGKNAYVTDTFINAVGDVLEQGDVVVIGGEKINHYYGLGNTIPVPEVDTTDRAYDTRVCGIVDAMMPANQVPQLEPPPMTEAEAKAAERRARRSKKTGEELVSLEHPLAKFAARVTPGMDTTRVENGQLGKMVTLGAYAFCKVDADIAPIAVGDLLTTSPTKGHAQKVLEPEKAIGAIIGKALAPLKKGKGKIPVMVLLH